MIDNKIILGIFFLLLIIFAFLLYFGLNQKPEIKAVEGEKFQGPVQEGYDEAHFRATGESKLLEVKNGANAV